MEKNESINEILNDLVNINNDRIAEYEKAINESKNMDIDLKAIFQNMIRESNQYKTALSDEIRKNSGTVEDETTTSGNIYRAWMQIKSNFIEKDRQSILESCEFTEDAVKRAYDSALASDQPITDEVRKVISTQKESLIRAHELIKKELEAHQQLQNKA